MRSHTVGCALAWSISVALFASSCGLLDTGSEDEEREDYSDKSYPVEIGHAVVRDSDTDERQFCDAYWKTNREDLERLREGFKDQYGAENSNNTWVSGDSECPKGADTIGTCKEAPSDDDTRAAKTWYEASGLDRESGKSGCSDDGEEWEPY